MIDIRQTGKPWESPELVARNRLPMRSPLFPFPRAEEALADAVAGPLGRAGGRGEVPAGNPWILSLDGRWRFALAASPEAAPAGWDAPGFDDGGWAEIELPGSWSLQGFDKPHYTNVVMPFGNVPPAAPSANPTGLHRLAFDLPAAWLGRRVVLRVGSAESFLSVRLNGVELGFSKDSRLPAEFDLGPALRGGSNLLALEVVRYSDASYVEDQDQWWLGGIHRGIRLYSTAAAHLRDVDARPRLSADLAAGRVELVASLGFAADPARFAQPEGGAPCDYARPPDGDAGAGLSGESLPGDGRAYRVRARLYGPFRAGGSAAAASPGSPAAPAAPAAPVASAALAPAAPVAEAETEVGALYRASRWEARISLPVAVPELWSAERPSLYALVVTLLDPEGRELESEACRLGFRSVELRDRALLVNGKRVILKGANRHEHDERRGRTLSTVSMAADIELLKRHNFNAVRASHCPNDERWYELCDEYGLYVFDEANIESHGHYDQLCRDPRWLPAFQDRVSRMALRDKNHASVIVWSLGNESGYGPNHDAAAAWLRAFDPTRPLHYEGACRPEWGQGPHPLDTAGRGAAATDLVSVMYPAISYLEEWDREGRDDRPLVMCEFSHAMGNSNGSLSDYWELVEGSRAIQGGFVWEFMDHGILVGEGGADAPTLREAAGPNAAPPGSRAGGKAWRYGGDFGDSPSDLDFIADGLVFPDRALKPAMAECAHLFRPIRASAALPAVRHSRAVRDASSPPAAAAGARFGRVFVENRFDFRDLSGVSLSWRILSGERGRGGGCLVAEGRAALPPIPAGGVEPVDLGLPVAGVEGAALRRAAVGGECVLELEFALAAPEPWAPAGHVLAREQLPLSEAPSAAVRRRRLAGGPALEARFSDDGFLSSLRAAGGAELLATPLVPCLFRAPTQNDGLKNFASLRGKPDFAFYHADKAMYGWLDAGLDRLLFELESFGESGGVTEIAHRLSTAKGVAAGRFLQSWNLGEGRVEAEFAFDLDPGLPELPRVGLRCRLAPGLGRTRWFGLGPHEAYSDRRAAARLGLWEADAVVLSTPYIVPQENGNRHGTRWLELLPVSGGAPALAVEGERPFDFSLSPYADEELHEARHWDRLRPFGEALREGAWLHLDAAQRGVGTATCGPDTLERHRLRPGLFRMSLAFGR
ncbi:MAG: DUF4981 domain-containing protein [Spirochaetaceae bacterium]|nr:DUF4981 domain-containing protein [Spirochaetaceae bacterium]